MDSQDDLILRGVSQKPIEKMPTGTSTQGSLHAYNENSFSYRKLPKFAKNTEGASSQYQLSTIRQFNDL